MPGTTPPTSATSSIKAVSKAPGNGTISDDPSTAFIPQRQTTRVFAFSTQSSWTPEAIAGIVFGVLMFLLGVIAVWQTRNRNLVFVRDIESRLMLPTLPTAHVFQTDPDLWVPPYEPPQDLVCIADPPDSYGNAHIKTLTGESAPKPEPKPKPPQPRDGYDMETDMADMLPNTEGNGIRILGGTGPKQPEPKPKPPQPRDGYDVETDLTDVLAKTEGNGMWILGGTGPKKPEPKPKPPQPRDGYGWSLSPAALVRAIIGKEAWKKPSPKPEPKPNPPQPRDGYRSSPSPTAWDLGGSALKPLQPADGYQVEVRALVSPIDDTTPLFSWFNDRHQSKAWVI